ncbi:MFS transporter [Massilia sp. TS11]|uniref:MFS transporter n=1 Tax=Massilia sp. TS11 TaxID=2908003 RepID=UPI001EDC4C5C|nr:MFS transporter [Massilia sp. TS11]MCG2584432.1 MFS transporter [Massilia sp. TS11]
MSTDHKAAVLASPNFRWLMSGGLISMLGDQFSMVALPWLVLKLTGNALTMASVIALMSLPRAVFILIGGAVVDRYSPKTVLMLTKHVNTVLLGLLAVMVYTNLLSMPMLYTLALAIGLASAFSIPSGSSMLPRTVPPEQLQAANGLMMAMRQMTTLAGPLLAGLLIALAGDSAHTGAVSDARGLALAFAFDAFSFAISAWTLAQVKPRDLPQSPEAQGILRSVGAGLMMVWNDRPLRACCLYWGLMACTVGGTFQVALPVLADTRLHGASAFGILMASHGIGTLVGMALSGMLGRLRIGNLGTTLLVIDMVGGLFILPMGLVQQTWQGVLILLIMGTMGGFMQVAVFTWIQRRVPPEMLGRMMSIFMFIFMGLAPLASVLTGALLQASSLSFLFLVAGGLLFGLALMAFAFTPIRQLADPEMP